VLCFLRHPPSEVADVSLVAATLNGAIDVFDRPSRVRLLYRLPTRGKVMARNTILHAMHDVGLAAWFGGTLANVISLNPAAGAAGDSKSTGAVANVGWDRWTPINAAAIGLHLIGSAGLLATNMPRLKAQRGVAAMSLAKAALTTAALGATAYSRALGTKVSKHDDVPAETGTEPDASTPPDAATAQRQLSMLQWAIPALTGAIEVVSAYASEQQRATEVHKGMLSRLIR
jgi:hypothetical protein